MVEPISDDEAGEQMFRSRKTATGRVDPAVGDFSIGGVVWPGLSKLIEEAGEVIQVCGKLIATGGDAEHWDGTNLVDRLHDELGDLVGAVAFFVKVNSLDKPRIIGRGADKFSLFTEWQQSNRTEADHGG